VQKPSLRLGFLASSNGTSARAIILALKAGELAAEARLIVTNNRNAPILDWARDHDVRAMCIPTQPDPAAADRELARQMAGHGVDLIILSGYLRKLGHAVLTRFRGRILNIHPGPLPAFGGEGMYGRRVHDAVVAAGVSESAIVIHLVDEEYDHGPHISTRAVSLLPGDTGETLEARINALEPALFIDTLQAISRGDLALPQARPAPSRDLG
jgi:phosphoribosylglycinamide formyltransferase 1